MLTLVVLAEVGEEAAGAVDDGGNVFLDQIAAGLGGHEGLQHHRVESHQVFQIRLLRLDQLGNHRTPLLLFGALSFDALPQLFNGGFQLRHFLLVRHLLLLQLRLEMLNDACLRLNRLRLLGRLFPLLGLHHGRRRLRTFAQLVL